jgi:hypothetical protein
MGNRRSDDLYHHGMDRRDETEKARALLGHYDSTMAEARRMVRGESERLRVGSPKVSHSPPTKTRFRCILFLFPTAEYRTSLWSPLPIRAQPGIYSLPGNEAKLPARCALCWTRLLLNLASLHKSSGSGIDRPSITQAFVRKLWPFRV